MNDFDRKVHGKISHYNDKDIAEQHDPQIFVDMIEGLLKTEYVSAVRWYQYTPYFNDGDACVFGVYEMRVLLANSDEDDGDYGDGYLSATDLYSYKDTSVKHYWNIPDNRIFEYKGLNTKEIHDKLSSLDREVNHQEVVMKRTFGDPAEIIAELNYDGEVEFNVAFYEHD